MTVVHCKRSKHDVYIGRPSKWGNPFNIGKDGSRDQVIEKYREWVLKQPSLMEDIAELEDKVLGCWCSPKNCHGDILAELAAINKEERVKAMSDKAIKDEVDSRPLDFKEIFDRYYHDNPKDWEYDRNLSVGASSAFQCIRKSFFDKHPDYKEDASYVQTWGAFSRGNLIEDNYIVPAMYHAEDNGISQGVLFNAGEDQRTIVKDVLSATPDGLIAELTSNALAEYGVPDIGSDCVVLEMKSIDPRVQLSEPKEIHVGQTQVQMGLIRDETDFKPNYAVLLYVDCSFFDNMSVFIVKFDPKQYKVATKRSKKIMDHSLEAKDFMAEGKINGSCDLCNYRDACAVVVQAGIPNKDDVESANDLSPEDAKTASALITAERATNKIMKDAEKAHKASKAALSEFITGKGRRLVRNEDFSVSIGWRKGKESLDKSSLIEDLETLNEELKALGKEDMALAIEDYTTTGNGYEVVTVRQK